MGKTLAFAAAFVGATLASSAHAGQSHGFVRGDVGAGYATFAGNDEERDSALAVRAGFFSNPNIGLEASYMRLGDYDVGWTAMKVTGLGLGLVAKTNFGAPARTGFFLQGRGGFMRVTTTASDSAWESEDGRISPYVGVGAGFDVTPSFGLSLDYLHARPDAFDQSMKVETFTVGGEFRF